MCAGLSVFPITAIEGMLFASPLVIAHLVAGVYGSAIFPFNSYLGRCGCSAAVLRSPPSPP